MTNHLNMDGMSDHQLEGYIGGTARTNNIPGFEQIMARRPELLFHSDAGQGSLYDQAASNNHPDFIRHLRRNYPELDPNMVGPYSKTAVIHAAWSGHDEALEALLEDEKIDLSVCWKSAHNALMTAFGRNDGLPMVERLLRGGADPDQATSITFEEAEPGAPMGENLPPPPMVERTNTQASLREQIMDDAERGITGAVNYLPVLAAYDQLPKLPEDLSGISEDALFEPNEHRKAFLDHPLNWKRLPEVVAALDAKGKTLTLTELTEGKNADGRSWMDLAADARCLGATLDFFAARGETLEVDSLIDARGRAQPLLSRLVTIDRGDMVFDPDLWFGEDPKRLRGLVSSLTPEAQEAIPNRHTLLANVSRSYRASEKQVG